VVFIKRVNHFFIFSVERRLFLGGIGSFSVLLVAVVDFGDESYQAWVKVLILGVFRWVRAGRRVSGIDLAVESCIVPSFDDGEISTLVFNNIVEFKEVFTAAFRGSEFIEG
jgi:hypothetical protein